MLEVWQQRLDTLKSNKLFELLVVGIIICSALLIGAHTYQDGKPQEGIPWLQILDAGITLFFLLEITVRFLAEKNKIDFFKNGWNIFTPSLLW